MSKPADNMTTFNMHIPKDLHTFLKHSAIKQATSVRALVTRCLEEYKKKVEKKNPNDEQSN